LRWSEAGPSAEYAAVERLARAAEGVLLLTATPVQLGQAGHFARLRLLDPDRFTSLAAYEAEAARYGALARVADALLAAPGPDKAVAAELGRLFPGDATLARHLDAWLAGEAGARDRLVDDLIDRHGTGRLMFRNRRQALGGFPPRVA